MVCVRNFLISNTFPFSLSFEITSIKLQVSLPKASGHLLAAPSKKIFKAEVVSSWIASVMRSHVAKTFLTKKIMSFSCSFFPTTCVATFKAALNTPSSFVSNAFRVQFSTARMQGKTVSFSFGATPHTTQIFCVLVIFSLCFCTSRAINFRVFGTLSGGACSISNDSDSKSHLNIISSLFFFFCAFFVSLIYSASARTSYIFSFKISSLYFPFTIFVTLKSGPDTSGSSLSGCLHFGAGLCEHISLGSTFSCTFSSISTTFLFKVDLLLFGKRSILKCVGVTATSTSAGRLNPPKTHLTMLGLSDFSSLLAALFGRR